MCRRTPCQYLTSVRDLEKKLEIGGSDCEAPAEPSANLGVEEHIEFMHDLLVLSFQCELTQVGTFMLGNALSGRNYGFAGINGSHQSMSHHGGRPADIEGITQIGVYEMERLCSFLQKLDAITEADGTTLLDSMALVCLSECGEPNGHNIKDLPVLTAGEFGGYFKTGQLIRYDEARYTGDLFRTVLNGLDIAVDAFGDDGSNPLSELLA